MIHSKDSPHSAGFARNPRWLQAAGCSLFRREQRSVSWTSTNEPALQPEDWSLQPHDADAEKIFACSEKNRTVVDQDPGKVA
jgi:hypothetical protein